MGSVYARGTRLWIRFKNADGKWVQSKSEYAVGDEALAREALHHVEDRIAAGLRFHHGKPRIVTVEDFSKHWIKSRKALGIRDWKGDERRLKLHVAPRIGGMPIADVRPRHLIDLVHALRCGGKLAPRTVHHVYGTLHVMFGDAAIAELINATPCVLKRAQLGKKEDKNPEWRANAIFSREELETLISSEQIPTDRQLVYGLAGLAGLRSGEFVALRWRHYDPDVKPLGRLVIAHSHEREGTKSGRTREVPVHPTLAAMLAEWKLGGWQELMGAPPGLDDLIIPSRQKEMRRRHHTRNKLLDDLKRLKLRHRRVHDLRRTFVTLARVDGARTDILERVSHGPRGNIVDLYTSLPWESLCIEVAKLRVTRRVGSLLTFRTIPQFA
ncbi:MAG: tyrosine-type recombinase/integrase [Deltaproteobacteria bacterium]